MPKVINQTSVSIDSLQTKLTLLENQFTKLTSEHKVILDSLRSLDKTMQKAELATTFYDTHLATYTTIFTVIVGLIATFLTVYNIFGIYKPLKEKVENLQNTVIPNEIDKIKAENSSQIQELTEVNDNLKHIATEGTNWGLKSMINHYENINDYSGVVLFTLRFIDFTITHEIFEDNIKIVKTYLNYAYAMAEKGNITINDITPYEDEIDTITKSIVDFGDDEIIESAVNFKKYLHRSNTPTSAIDVDQAAGEEPQPSQD